jgi:ATP-dependent protease ClpP protease subunit/HAMP domain-containing protein
MTGLFSFMPPAASYLVFSGYIDQLAVQRVFGMTAAAIQDGVSEVHLLMQSVGGSVADGVCLYNYFRTFPVPVTIYNAGGISSAAVLAYLGAPHRLANRSASFMVHRSHATLLAGRLWQVTREADHSVAAAREQVSALADLATTQHQELISKTRTLLNILVRVPAVRDGLVDQCHILLRDLARGAAWQRRIWVVGTDGRARCGSHSPRADLDIADRDYFQRALQTKQFVVSDYVTTRVRNQPAIIAALPALDDYGDVEMVALVTLNVEAAEHPMKALDQGSHAILMVDSANVTISWRGAGEHSPEAIVGKRIPEGPLSSLLKDSAARQGEAVGPDGVERIWSFARLSQPEGVIAVGVAKADVLAGARWAMLRSIGVLLLIGALAGLAVWFGAEFLLLRNIRALADAANQIGKGNLLVRPGLPPSAGEFHMLADALNGMAEQLAARDAELRHSKLILGEKTAFLEGTLEHMDQGLIMFDDAATVQVCNRRAMELLELPAALMLSRPSFQDVTRYQFERNEFGKCSEEFKDWVKNLGFEPIDHVYERQRPNGRVLEIRTTPLPGGGAVRTYSDVTERKSAESRILHTARHDVLTDLPNRLLFRERLQEALAGAERSRQSFAVLWLDLDRFKAVNDALGRIALDDFGTGYSSLSYLRLFSFDKIKIDRSFVRELAANPESLAFIRTIVSLGSTLGMPVCVEGVETQDQYDWVCALGCNEIQGFLISRPRPAAQILDMITEGALRAA